MNTHELVRHAIGFDLEMELALCQRLATVGGVESARDEFDSFRARRLFQALLSTGRYTEMSEHWRESVEGRRRGRHPGAPRVELTGPGLGDGRRA